MYKTVTSIIALIFLLTIVLFMVTKIELFAADSKTTSLTAQKSISTVDEMNNNFDQADLIDFTDIANQYYQLISSGTDPNIHFTAPGYNVSGDVTGTSSYVGGTHDPGSQEAINMIASFVAFEMLGYDTSANVNYVLEFFNSTNGENIYLNNSNTASGNTAWYEILPNVLFMWYYDVSENPQLDPYFNSVLTEFSQMVSTLASADGVINYDDYTAYNFKTDELTYNGMWSEADMAVGGALILYYGYEQTGNPTYLDQSIILMDYVDSLNYNPTYEVLAFFSPLLAAKLNAEHNTNYNISKMINWNFNETSGIRYGWGMINGQFSNYDVDGLYGSTIDYNGYAFSMNSYMMGISMASLPKYDSTYADATGKYLYNLADSLRYFYAPYVTTQTGTPEEQVQYAMVPYEGLKNETSSGTVAGGDAKENGWATTDFSVYSGAYSGIFSQIVEYQYTNGVTVFDLDSVDFYATNTNENYLLYNPTTTDLTVDLSEFITTSVALYDVLNRQYLQGTSLVIPAGKSALISTVPDTQLLVGQGSSLYYDGELISSTPVIVDIANVTNYDVITTQSLPLQLTGTYDPLTVDKVTVYLNDLIIYEGAYQDNLIVDLTNSNNGIQYLTVQIDIGTESYYDTKIIDIQGPEELVYDMDPLTLEPIPGMPGTIEIVGDTVVITENNPTGSWGGAKTPEIVFDFNEKYTLTIVVDDVTDMWAMQLKIPNDPLNPDAYYIKGDGAEVGTLTFTLPDVLYEQTSFTYDDIQNASIGIIASGAEGASVTISDMYITKQRPIYYNYPLGYVYTNEDIRNLANQSPTIDVRFNGTATYLVSRAETGSAKFSLYPAKYDGVTTTTIDLDNLTNEVNVYLTNKTTSEQFTVATNHQGVIVVDPQAYGVNVGDIYEITIEIVGPAGSEILLNGISL